MELYLADKDVPASFTKLVAAGGEEYAAEGLEKGTAVETITVAATGVYHLGFVPASAVSANFNLYSFKLTHLVLSGIDAAADEGSTSTWTDNAKQLHVSGSYEHGAVYDVNGSEVIALAGESVADMAMLHAGIYIVKLVSGEAVTTTKIVLK